MQRKGKKEEVRKYNLQRSVMDHKGEADEKIYIKQGNWSQEMHAKGMKGPLPLQVLNVVNVECV